MMRKMTMSRGHGVSSYTHTQQQLDAYANQHNPNNQAYLDDLDNHANQCNPNNANYQGHQKSNKDINNK